MITVLHTGNPPNSFTGCGGFFCRKKAAASCKTLEQSARGHREGRGETVFFKTGSAHKKAGYFCACRPRVL